MVKTFTSKDIRKEVSTKKDHFIKPKCVITGKTEDAGFPLQVDHIVECQAVAVCINLLIEAKFSEDETDKLVHVIREHWINSELFLKNLNIITTLRTAGTVTERVFRTESRA